MVRGMRLTTRAAGPIDWYNIECGIGRVEDLVETLRYSLAEASNSQSMPPIAVTRRVNTRLWVCPVDRWVRTPCRGYIISTKMHQS